MLTRTDYGRFSYRPTWDKNEYANFCKLAKAWANAALGETWIIIEEAGALSQSIGKAVAGEFELISQGAKYGVVLGYIIQSMSDGTKTILKNCARARLGVCDAVDVDYLEHRFGKEVGAALRKLRGKEAILYNRLEKRIEGFLPDTSK